MDAHALVSDVIGGFAASDEGGGKRVAVRDASRDTAPVVVKVDQAQTRKALSYLVGFLAHNTQGDEASVSVSVARNSKAGEPDQAWILVASKTAEVDAERLARLFDPVQMVQESLIDVGPAVSQRLVEAQGGQLQIRQGRQELGFLVAFPVAAA